MNPRTHGATDMAAVTPNDTVSAATQIASTKAAGDPNPAGLIVAADGNVKVQMISGNQATFYALAGLPYPLQFTHVLATGTTATGIVALFQ